MPSPIPDHLIARGLDEARALGLVAAWEEARTDGATWANSPRRYRITWPDGRADTVGAGYAFAYGRGVREALEEVGAWPASL